MGWFSGNDSAVVFHSYPKLLFCWPIIAMGYLFYFIAPADGGETLAWIYMLATAMVLLTLGIDIERNHAFFWLVVFLLFFFLGRWLQDAKGFTLFGDVYGWFASLDARYPRGMGLALSILLSGPYAVMLIWARLQDKWRITHNEFEHHSWGKADDSLARGAKRVRAVYPDLLELILGGAGTLIVYSATGSQELRRIPHVPLLFRVRKKIDLILERTAVTNTAARASSAQA